MEAKISHLRVCCEVFVDNKEDLTVHNFKIENL